MSIRRTVSKVPVERGLYADPTGQGSISVLVAEDDPLTRDVLIAVLEEAGGFQVVGTAEDAGTAIDLADKLLPDLVLLDVRMPGGGGPRAASEISANGHDVRVVAISAHDDAVTVGEMLNAGATGYLTKDSPHAAIVETLRRCAAGESVFTPPSASTVMRDYALSSKHLEEIKNRRHEREERLLEACDPHAINPVFQPILDLETNEQVMCEALTRFDTSHKFNTGEWFAEANDLGMCPKLELAALRRSISELQKHGDETMVVSINVSPQTLLDPELVTILAMLDPEHVVLEITEYAEIEDYEATKAVLEELRASGMRLAIDDAGAGYASLRHILDLMPDLIKLDITLVRSIDSDPARHALAAGLTSFAREIGAEIVAEGIETQFELECLRELGVQLGQGFHLARPAPLNGARPVH